MAFDAYRVHALALRQRREVAGAPPPVFRPLPGRVRENRTGSQPDRDGPPRRGGAEAHHQPAREEQAVTTTIEPAQAQKATTRVLALDVTRKCQAQCGH